MLSGPLIESRSQGSLASQVTGVVFHLDDGDCYNYISVVWFAHPLALAESTVFLFLGLVLARGAPVIPARARSIWSELVE